MHGEARGVAVKVRGVEVHNLYVPAGGDEPDPEINPKFAHKLDFIDRMDSIYTTRRAGNADPLIVVGDLNIAPEEHDVWSHKQLLKVVSHTPIEVDGLKRIISNGGFTDIARAARGPDEKLYTWWSYRANARNNNKGWRIDYNLVAQPLQDKLKRAVILPEAEHSDHCPHLVEFEF